VGNIVLLKNEPIYKHEISAARVQDLLCRKNRDIFEATINYWREIGEWSITTNMHLNQLYPFIEFEKPQPQKIEQQRP
jgi:hypothetical protein